MTNSNDSQSTSDGLERWTLRWMWAQISEIVQGYLKTHLGTALWAVSLLLGGVLFILYFWRIGFMPEMDFSGSVTVLVASAFTGVIVFTLLAMFLGMPGWVWAKVTKGSVSPGWFFWPWLAIYLEDLLPPSWSRYLVVRLNLGRPEVLYGIFLSGLLLITIVVMLVRIKGWKARKDIIVGLLGTFTFFVLALSVLSALVGTGAAPAKNPTLIEGITSRAQIAYFMVLILGFNAITGYPKRADQKPTDQRTTVQKKTVWQAFLTGALLLSMLLVLTLNFTLISSAVMKIYKFGNFKATLLVDETGCAIAGRNGIAFAEESKTAVTATPKTCSLPNVTILSRLGNGYYVRGSGSGEASPVCFTIPGQHVLSWAATRSEKGDPPCP